MTFPSDAILSMKLPDSTVVFITEMWAIIKTLEDIKNSVATKYIVFTDSLQTLLYMKLEHPLTGMVIWKCVVLTFDKRTLVYVGYTSMMASGIMRRQTVAKFALEHVHTYACTHAHTHTHTHTHMCHSKTNKATIKEVTKNIMFVKGFIL